MKNAEAALDSMSYTLAYGDEKSLRSEVVMCVGPADKD